MASAWRIPRMIELGEFDKFLLRPLSLIKFLFLSGFDLDGLGNVVVGLFIICYAVLTGGFKITLLAVIIYLFILVLGIIVEFCALLLVVALSFLFVKTEVIWNVLDTIFEFSRYPITIYGGFLQFVLTFVLPFSLSSFYPVEALLGRLNLWLLVPITVAVSMFILVSTMIFKLGLKKYTSAGG
jgi:ABC-2 type transport system permease protein